MSSIFVVDVVIAPDPIQDPHTAKEIITAANVTSRVVVIVLFGFGTVVAVWVALGMPLLYGRILVLARVVFCLFGTFFTYSYFLTMTIVHTALPKNTEFTP